MKFFSDFFNSFGHHMADGAWWGEKLAENVVALGLFAWALAYMVHKLDDFRDRRRARKGLYDNMMVVSATYLADDGHGNKKLKLRSVGRAYRIADIFTNSEDQRALQKAMKQTCQGNHLLDLDPSAEGRIVPDLLNFVSHEAGASPIWISEMRAGKGVVPMELPYVALTCEHGDHQTTKLRVVLTTEEHLKNLPGPQDWDAMVADSRHTIRFSTLQAIHEKNQHNLAQGKKALPRVELPAYYG